MPRNCKSFICSCLLTSFPLTACDGVDFDAIVAAPPLEDEASAPLAHQDEMEAAIQDLSGLEGPDVDEARRRLPVPAAIASVEEEELVEVLSGSPGLLGHLRAVLEEAPVVVRTVFGNDDREWWRHDWWPFTAVGRVDTPIEGCTGFLVGRRILVTASHCIDWKADGTTGWIRFAPGAYGTNEPYGAAWGTNVRFLMRLLKGGKRTQKMRAHDFVLIRLDRAIGDSVGYLGAEVEYTTNYNNIPMFHHVGYPIDHPQGDWPAVVHDCEVEVNYTYCTYIDITGDCTYAFASYCDTVRGHSGGPLFFWKGTDPLVIGVASGESATFNWFGGGDAMTRMILKARNDWD
jgi:V8-like Glu-specific endopeptidase